MIVSAQQFISGLGWEHVCLRLKCSLQLILWRRTGISRCLRSLHWCIWTVSSSLLTKLIFHNSQLNLVATTAHKSSSFTRRSWGGGFACEHVRTHPSYLFACPHLIISVTVTKREGMRRDEILNQFQKSKRSEHHPDALLRANSAEIDSNLISMSRFQR